MQRRNFIRLLGGGTLALATLPLSGCSADYPPEAVAAWAGPPAEADLRHWALGYALLSPSAHNLQSWQVDLREPDAITLHVDRERLLPATDPHSRQIMVSQGCFIEAVLIALRQRGIEAQLQLFPEGEVAPREIDARPVARISWTANARGAAPDPLFAQLLHRSTSKLAYDTQHPVPPELLARLLDIAMPSDVAVAGTVDPGRIARLRQLCLASAEVELLTHATMMENLRLTRVGPAEILQHRDGVSVNTPFARAMSSLGLFDRSHAPAPDGAAYKAMHKVYEDYSLTAMGFAWLSTAPGRRGEVEAGRAWLRLQLRATALGLQLHPMSQSLQEFPEMREHYLAVHQDLLGSTPDQRVLQMFGRLGFGAPGPHTPRRELHAIIRA